MKALRPADRQLRSRHLNFGSAKSRCLHFEITVPTYIAWYGKTYAAEAKNVQPGETETTLITKRADEQNPCW